MWRVLVIVAFAACSRTELDETGDVSIGGAPPSHVTARLLVHTMDKNGDQQVTHSEAPKP